MSGRSQEDYAEKARPFQESREVVNLLQSRLGPWLIQGRPKDKIENARKAEDCSAGHPEEYLLPPR